MSEQAIVLADRSGTICYWSEGATELFGHSRDRAVGASLDLIVPERYRRRHWAGFRRAWSDGLDDNPRIAVMPALCADGVSRAFPARLLPVRGPHGDLAAIAGVYSAPSDRDVTLFEFR